MAGKGLITDPGSVAPYLQWRDLAVRNATAAGEIAAAWPKDALRPTGEWLNQPGGLAERMQRMRKAAGLTGDRLAASLGWPRSKVPKIENGRQMPTEADIAAWAQACGQPTPSPSCSTCWPRRSRSTVSGAGAGGHDALQAEYDALVRGGKVIREFEVTLMPGLLQTPDYARYRAPEVVRVHGTDRTASMRRWRPGCGGRKSSTTPAKTFEFVITEAVLRFLLCPRAVMPGQLDRLPTASEFGNVTLGIIPFGTELAVAPVTGFLVVDDTMIVETFTSRSGDGSPKQPSSQRSPACSRTSRSPGTRPGADHTCRKGTPRRELMPGGRVGRCSLGHAEGTLRAHHVRKRPDAMGSVEIENGRSARVPVTCRR